MSTSGNFGDYLDISFAEDGISNSKDEDVLSFNSKRLLPFADSPLYYTSVVNVKQLTKGVDIKSVYDVTFDGTFVNHSFLPGDTIGILPCNDEIEVELILSRLNLTSVARKLYSLSILKETTKKKPVIPTHIPAHGTLCDLFMNNLDVRSIPKKLFLRSLARFTSDQAEVEKLQHLSSPKGSQEYNEFITKHRTLLSLLAAFPCCNPPIERLLENLPPLQPRPYSISSSPLVKPSLKELHITFAVIETDYGSKGVCSGWLESIIVQLAACKSQESGSDIADRLEKSLVLQCGRSIPFYFRKANNFRLPADPTVPIIMIGPGTGVAPFIGFLQHRQFETEANKVKFGSSWLVYGCRYSDKDFLYKDEIEQFLSSGTLTKLFACFSRESPRKTYVQDVIKANAIDFIAMMVRGNAIIYVCGDAKNMAKDVRKTFISCLVEVEGLSTSDAEVYIKNLEQINRYIQDVWI